MSTRSNIAIKLRESDKGKTISSVKNLLPVGTHSVRFKDVEIPVDAEYVVIYCHFDGYPEGVGRTLLSDYNSYEKALNLCLLGDVSAIIDGVRSYYSSEYEEDFYIRFVNNIEDIIKEEYAYLFMDGKWYWTDESKWSVLTRDNVGLPSVEKPKSNDKVGGSKVKFDVMVNNEVFITVTITNNYNGKDNVTITSDIDPTKVFDLYDLLRNDILMGVIDNNETKKWIQRIGNYPNWLTDVYIPKWGDIDEFYYQVYLWIKNDLDIFRTFAGLKVNEYVED